MGDRDALFRRELDNHLMETTNQLSVELSRVCMISQMEMMDSAMLFKGELDNSLPEIIGQLCGSAARSVLEMMLGIHTYPDNFRAQKAVIGVSVEQKGGGRTIL